MNTQIQHANTQTHTTLYTKPPMFSLTGHQPQGEGRGLWRRSDKLKGQASLTAHNVCPGQTHDTLTKTEHIFVRPLTTHNIVANVNRRNFNPA